MDICKVLLAISVLIGGAFVFAGCDNSVSGGGDLQEINEVNFEGFQDSYTVFLTDTLTINPVLTFTKDTQNDTSRYDYEWFVVNPANNRRTDLVKTKNLNLLVKLAPSLYEGYYRVTDSQTGVQFKKKFSLQVASPVYKGWLLMTDVNGEAKLGMVAFISDSSTTPNIHPDVLAFTQSSLKLQGAPVDITTYPFEVDFYGIYVTSEETGTTKIDPNTFDWNAGLYLSYEMQATGIPEDFGVDFLQPAGGGRSCFIYKDGDIYYYYDNFNSFYGAPINKLSDEVDLIQAAPYIAAGNGLSIYYNHTIMYDEVNQRFFQHNAFGSAVSRMPEGGEFFDYNNVGLDLDYMTVNRYNNSGSQGGTVFAVFDSSGTKILAEMNEITAFFSFNLTQTYYAPMTGTDVEKAEHYAPDPTFGYMFYSVGGKVYQYDKTAKKSRLMIDKPGQQVTFLGTHTVASQKLIVAFNDPSKPAKSSGTMELYNILPVHQQITLDKQYSGFGKIIDIDYRER